MAGTKRIDPFEIYMNEMAADVHVFRLIVQIVLKRTLSVRQNPAADFAELRDELLQTIQQMPLLAEDADGSRRRRELEFLRAEEFFAEIAESLGIMTPRPPAASH